MKILYFVYPSAFQSPGGGEIMLLKTKEALEKKGVEPKLFNQWEDKLKNYDILHVFGSVKECLPLMEAAKSAGIKVVLSPIYWSTLTRAFHEYGSIPNKAVLIARHLLKVFFPNAFSARRMMMRAADVLLPNSAQEAEQISRLFAIDKKKMHIVPLGADDRFIQAAPDKFRKTYGIDGFILSVGRIEPRKNQLNLIKAMKDNSRKLVFIGDAVIGYESYYRECVRLAGERALFLSRLSHDSEMLASAYAACGVFVLQGWFETPGLAALEAGLAGAKLAVTEGGSTKEYFKDYVQYFSPSSLCSIKLAVNEALLMKKTDDLKQHIYKHYLWSHSADENILVYKSLLA